MEYSLPVCRPASARDNGVAMGSSRLVLTQLQDDGSSAPPPSPRNVTHRPTGPSCPVGQVKRRPGNETQRPVPWPVFEPSTAHSATLESRQCWNSGYAGPSTGLGRGAARQYGSTVADPALL